MPRDHSILDRCRDCGSAVRVLVHEYDEVDDQGDPYRALYAERVPHDSKACSEMKRLAREEWPVLPFG